jgi:hypothetical protein
VESQTIKVRTCPACKMFVPEGAVECPSCAARRAPAVMIYPAKPAKVGNSEEVGMMIAIVGAIICGIVGAVVPIVGAAWVALGCLIAIFARMAQAEMHQKKLIHELRRLKSEDPS